MWFWIANRRLGSKVIGLIDKERGDPGEWRKIWDARHQWLRGY